MLFGDRRRSEAALIQRHPWPLCPAGFCADADGATGHRGPSQLGEVEPFNALTGGSALVAGHPFSTTETTVGVARVPDHRVDALGEMSASRKVVHATVEFVDIAGLVAGASTGEGLGNRFLAGIREADALCLVLRAFVDRRTCPATPIRSPTSACWSWSWCWPTLAPWRARSTSGARPPEPTGRWPARWRPSSGPTSNYRRARRSTARRSSPEERALLRPFFLLTNKPVLAVVNLGEDQVEETDETVKPVAAELGGHGDVLGVSVAAGGGGRSARPRVGPSCSKASVSARAPCPGWPGPPITCWAGARS